MSELPLKGRIIVVTRPRRQVSRLRTELEALGACVIELPTIEIVPPESYEPLDAALQDLSQYQWLIVTSANTVPVLAGRLALLQVEPSSVSGVQVVAVGSATAAALREAGFRVDLIPPKYVAESVVDILRDKVAGSRVLLTRAAVARDVIPDELRRLGATVDVVDAYRSAIPEESIALVSGVFLNTPLPDAVTFTSSSTATNFFHLLEEARICSVPEGVRALSIGPITSATLRELGWEPAAEAEQHDVDGLVQATLRALPPSSLCFC
ncbi:uroporphyrinogen-III synthase [Alloacidobacterium dinghuense]|uniref:Uroporphyrinogen-III synthase n=1 Tax=Alloacidobacterium dinghuense TaxID=2763107 RepID=A0A7G8BN28_9BACT|nr:uroporphyrinogen-III synthase [Alloacidobacterium dinghuense]QNI33948.1 uroporphyrinogen-III synthase [Alloacidobacterium dinghuense]